MNQNPGPSNATLLREYCCAQCWGGLVERPQAGTRDLLVACPKGCQPGGFVTLSWTAEQRAQSAADLEDVARAYPQFDPRPKLSAEEKRKRLAALFGEES